MSNQNAAFAVASRVPVGDGITFCVYCDSIGSHVHVSREEAERLAEKFPHMEWEQRVFGRAVPSMAFFVERREG